MSRVGYSVIDHMCAAKLFKGLSWIDKEGLSLHNAFNL